MDPPTPFLSSIELSLLFPIRRLKNFFPLDFILKNGEKDRADTYLLPPKKETERVVLGEKKRKILWKRWGSESSSAHITCLILVVVGHWSRFVQYKKDTL